MATKYLYIDDNPINRTDNSSNPELGKGFLLGLTIPKQLSFDEYSTIASKSKDEKWLIREDLEKFIKENSYQGILFDWNLTASSSQIANGDSSVGLAQHIRQIVSFDREGNRNPIGTVKDVPLVLCSSKENIKEIMNLDKTGFDLFDMIYARTEMTVENEYHTILLSLSNGYRKLNQANRNYDTVLGISESEFQNLDIRFQAELNSLLQSPSHEIARFILREVIEYQGILVDEYVLAARLGIDISLSGKAWNTLKEELKTCKYNGIFGEAWERWWWFGVENWWKVNFEGKPLRSSNASKRVDWINERSGCSLVAAKKRDKSKSKSDLFWTACYFSHQPLDTIDGFTLLQDETIKAWQEKRYASIDYVLESENVAIATIEKPRFTKLKELYGNR